MKELLDSLNADFDDAEGWIRLVDADWFADDLKLTLSIHFHDNRDVELWEVSCVGVVEDSLCSNETGVITVSADSPLLKPFLEPEVDITFSQNTVVPETLFGIVCSCCIEVMGRPESITRFMNAVPTISGISSSNFGLLGRFPESLAARILHALKDMPIIAHALPGRLPKRWNGSTHVDYEQLHALEIGPSYVVAEQFEACRV
ncbi:MAG: hypothetical protein V4508_16915 [Pseudomonadota bacterium]